MIEPASGVVLAGGRSLRLGRDKRLLKFGAADTQLEETVRRVASVATEVVVAGGAEVTLVADVLRHAPPRTTVVPDVQPGAGPLGGLCAGLAAAREDLSLGVACDLPFLNVDVLRYLLECARGYDLVVPRRDDGRLEMLHAVYRRSCLPILRERLARGRLRLGDVPLDLDAAGLRVRYVAEADLIPLDPHRRTFFNVNTQGDLQAAEHLLAGESLER